MMNQNKKKISVCAFKVLFLAVIAFLAGAIASYAQVPINVEGKIFIQTENEKGEDETKPVAPEDVMLYYFDSYSEALSKADELRANLNAFINWEFVQKETVELDGSFVVYDALTGGGLLACGTAIGSQPVTLRLSARDGEEEVRIILKSEGVTLQGVTISGQSQAVGADPPVPEQFGNVIFIKDANISIPSHIGKTSARLVICPFVYNHDRKDTAHYRAPRVYAGKEFYMSQKRHVGFDEKKDLLFGYTVSYDFDEKNHKYVWSDTVVCPNATENFQVLGRYYFEDYLGVYKEDSIILTSRYKRRPMRFLQYDFAAYELDPNEYRDVPKTEKREGSEDISLSFVIGKAELDMNDPNNEVELKKLEDKIYGLVNDKGSLLRRIEISSVSSPDGSYALNYNLSVKRLAFAQKLVKSKIPAKKLIGVTDLTDPRKSARVAKWTELADILYADTLEAEPILKDSLVSVAGKIYDIAKQYSNHDMQSARISRLPEYNSLIKRYLPRLRSMKFEYTAQVHRALTTEEIMEKYNDYKAKGIKEMDFKPYEYWHLFQMVKDTFELENLYRLAYKSSLAYYRGTVSDKILYLAANNLARSYINRDTFDIQVLKPLINEKVQGVNVPRKTVDGQPYVVNKLEIVANQLLMCLKKDDYENAGKYAKMLKSRQNEDERIKQLVAVTYCLRGYYRVTQNLPEEEKKERLEFFDTVCKTSPMNEVVMYLAMNSTSYNNEAINLLSDMPYDNPLVQYLKAVAYGRMGDTGFNDAMMALKTCFMLDSKYVGIASTDGDIPEDLYKSALELYEIDKELMELSGGY